MARLDDVSILASVVCGAQEAIERPYRTFSGAGCAGLRTRPPEMSPGYPRAAPMPPQFVTREDFRGASTMELLQFFFGSKTPAALAEPGTLRTVFERPPRTAAERRLHAGAELARRVAFETQTFGSVLASPKETSAYLVQHFFGRTAEVFAAMFLDNRHRLLAVDDLFFGTIDGASVHPREVVRRAMERNASAVIVAHNHPSGVAEPSQADELITKRLKEALALVDIRVLDHIVVAGPMTISLAERGLI